MMDRQTVLDALTKIDVLVIGGGITELVPRETQHIGLKVALVEMHDFIQSSSRSSKLVHGGLRY